MTNPKTRAYNAIIHNIASFCLTSQYASGHVSSGYRKFTPDDPESPAQVDDLIALQCAPVSQWSFSWIIEIDRSDEKRIGPRYLLESILTGERCWWSNVSVIYFDRSELIDRWRWTDRQWAFSDRWVRTCRKNHDKTSSLMLGVSPVFHPDGSVTLRARKRWSHNVPLKEKTVPNWKKFTVKMMVEAINEIDDTRN